MQISQPECNQATMIKLRVTQHTVNFQGPLPQSMYPDSTHMYVPVRLTD